MHAWPAVHGEIDGWHATSQCSAVLCRAVECRGVPWSAVQCSVAGQASTAPTMVQSKKKKLAIRGGLPREDELHLCTAVRFVQLGLQLKWFLQLDAHGTVMQCAVQ